MADEPNEILDISDLRKQINTYTHRDYKAFEANVFIHAASMRIGHDLKSKANENHVVMVPEPSGVYFLPDDYVEMRFVSAIQNGNPTTLLPISKLDAERFKPTGSNAGFYYIESAVETAGTPTTQYQLVSVPAVADLSISVTYWAIPELSEATNSATNAVLRQYGFLYLYASLVEAFSFALDDHNFARYVSVYDRAIERINEQATRGRVGGAGMAVSAPARLYNSAPSRAM